MTNLREEIIEAINSWRFDHEWVASKAEDFPQHKGAGCGCAVCQKVSGLNNEAADYIEALIQKSNKELLKRVLRNIKAGGYEASYEISVVEEELQALDKLEKEL